MDFQDEDLQVVLNKAYFYLKFRPRTKKEVKTYLIKKTEKTHIVSTTVDLAMKNLEERNLINDKDFIEWFVNQRSTGKPKGKYALVQELLRFGVEKELIDEYFSTENLEEDELAKKALERKWERFKTLDHQVRFQKAATFLGRRGFGFDVIKKTIKFFEKEL